MLVSSQSRSGVYSQTLKVTECAHSVPASATSCSERQRFESVEMPLGQVTRFQTKVHKAASAAVAPAAKVSRWLARAARPAAGSFSPKRERGLGRGMLLAFCSLCGGHRTVIDGVPRAVARSPRVCSLPWSDQEDRRRGSRSMIILSRGVDLRTSFIPVAAPVGSRVS